MTTFAHTPHTDYRIIRARRAMRAYDGPIPSDKRAMRILILYARSEQFVQERKATARERRVKERLDRSYRGKWFLYQRHMLRTTGQWMSRSNKEHRHNFKLWAVIRLLSRMLHKQQHNA